MSFRLFSISSMYQGSIDSFYITHPGVSSLNYNDHLAILLADTTEFVGVYLRNFRKLGIESECAIANEPFLQSKWGKERGIQKEKTANILFDQVLSFSPDVLLIENLSYVTPELISNIRHNVKSVRLIVANHCSPFNQKVLESLKNVDFVFTCTPGLKSAIEVLGKKSYVVYHGFDADLLPMLNPDITVPKKDLVFSGSLISGGDFHTQRIRLIERIIKENMPIELYVNLENPYKIKVKQSIYLLSNFLRMIKMEKMINDFRLLQYGKSWVDSYSNALLRNCKLPLYGMDMFNLFLNSRIVLNFHIGVAGNYAGNMRMFEVTGIGSCLLTDNKKNMEELFKTGSEVVVYDNVEDCIEKATWLLEHEEERKMISKAGQMRTLKYHTVEIRCRSIIEIINKELLFQVKKV